MGGESFPLEDDTRVLEVRSPKSRLGGPYMVVYRDLHQRWAVVAMEWDGEPVLGMRWFTEACGTPSSRGFPTWMVIPCALYDSILASLNLTADLRRKVDDFLVGEVNGNELLPS